MKKYLKPVVEINELILNENISALNDWLVQNGLEEAGITTYVVNS